MDKEDILNRVEDFTAEQLFDFISQGTVTLVELQATRNLDGSKRRAIRNLQNELDQKDHSAWEDYKKTEQGCIAYLNEFPAGKHKKEANDKIEQYKKERERIREEKEGILNKLRQNYNEFTAGEIMEFLDQGKLSRHDLIDIDVPEAVIDRLYNFNQPSLKIGKSPDSIPAGYTEVYFWGIPGSGKTCALAGVLSTANSKGYLEIAEGPGYNYMTQLKNMFANSVSALPPPTTTDITQYLPFVLNIGRDNPRSVSLIELSGEIFQCFFDKTAGKELDPNHEKTLTTLLGFLRGANRKIHFFFIDYEKENVMNTDGITQADYLSAATTYFNNNDIFTKSTDAIYIVVTKSDLMPVKDKDRVSYVKDYLKNANFTAFMNSLKRRCDENSINGGKLIGTHFSLGTVFFEKLCSFDNTTAGNIIDILKRRIEPKRRSILDVLNN